MDTIASYLADDHHRCDALLTRACASVRAARWTQAVRELADYADAIERHLLLEERIIFPAFEAAIARVAGKAVPPTAEMRAEHLRIRAVVQRMRNSLHGCDTVAFFDHADSLALFISLHSEKEEGMLYPLIDRMLQHQREELVAAMTAFGAFDAMLSLA